MKYTILIILTFTLLIVSTYSSINAKAIYSIRTDKYTKKVNTKNLNGIAYINSHQLSKSVFKQYKFQQKINKYSNNEYTISFIPGSFFILMDDWSGPKVSQMKLPVVKLGKENYFPLLSLIESLDSLGVFEVKYSKDGKHINLQSTRYFAFNSSTKLPKLRIIKNTFNDGQTFIMGKSYSDITPFRDEFLSTAKKLVESLENLKPIRSEEFINLILPDKSTEIYIEKLKKLKSKLKTPYSIPKGLSRKELDEIKKSDSGGME